MPTLLRFILGGMNLGRYPAFNGQFKNIIHSVGKGAFVDTLEDVNNKLEE